MRTNLVAECHSRKSMVITILSALIMILMVASALPVRSHAETVPAGQRLDFLSLDIEELMNIEVTSVSKKSQRLSDAAAAVFVITQKDIRRSGVTNIAEALRMAPGVQVARIDANKWAVSIRGLNGRFANKLLVLMDGRSLYSPLFAGVYWEVQDTALEDIDRIEVIRGPGAALWGSNAVNGVINIITKPADATQGAMLSAGAGTEARGFATARYGLPLGSDSYLRLYGKSQKTDNAAGIGGVAAHDQWHMSRGGFRLDAQPSFRDSLTLSADYYDGRTSEKYTLYRLPSAADPSFSSTPDARSQMNGGNLLLRWQRTLAESESLSLQLYYDRAERSMILLGEKQNVLDLEFQHRVALPARHDFIWGAGFRYSSDSLRATDIISFHPAERKTHLVSGFLHDEISIVPDRLSLILGSRFEHNSYTGFEVQPNGRLLWTPTPDHSVWGAVSRAVRTPARGDSDIGYRYSIMPAAPPGLPLPVRLEINGNPGFQSETVLAYEAGYRTKALPQLTFDLALFYHSYDRLRVITAGEPFAEPAGAPPSNLVQPFQLANLMHGRTYGFELAAEWSLAEWWRLHASYSYFRARMLLDSPSVDSVSRGNAEGDTPRHQASLRSSLDLGRGVELDLWLRGVDRIGFIDSISIPGYLTMDARLAWRPQPGLELALVGQNLLQSSHVEFYPEFINTFHTGVQRGVYAKATWNF